MKLNTRSLSFKLTLAFLVVSVLGTILVALLVNWQTRRQFSDFVNELYQDQLNNLSDQWVSFSQNWFKHKSRSEGVHEITEDKKKHFEGLVKFLDLVTGPDPGPFFKNEIILPLIKKVRAATAIPTTVPAHRNRTWLGVMPFR